MKTDLDLVRQGLQSLKTTEWEQVAREAGCTPSLPRKIVYEPDRNFMVGTIRPLVVYFKKRAAAAAAAAKKAKAAKKARG